MPPLRRHLLLAVLVTFITLIIFTTRYGYKAGHLPNVDDWIRRISAKEPAPTPCVQHLGWLDRYQFTKPISYVSRDIITIPSQSGERPSVTVVDRPLFDAFSTINLAESQTVHIDKCLHPLVLEVPRGKLPPPDASNMIFGLQTTMLRLRDTVKHLERWLAHTNARLYAIVIAAEELAADDEEMRKLERQFQEKGMNVTLVHPVNPIDSFSQRYFSLVNVMYAARDENTQWVTLIDDDTFFPSLHNLLITLAQIDASKPQYIGSLSEDWWAVNNYGLMGFGGAGIILSIPMAKIIDDHTSECKDHPRTTAGDITVMDCVYHLTSVKLTNIPALHQVDMHKDLSGFYESGREILSLHHWKEGSAAGYKLEMEKMHLVADICDSCFLQRWQFPHELVLSNGFSIVSYPQGHISGKKPGILGTGVGPGPDVAKINLDEMEETWADHINVLHSLAPTRPVMIPEAKISYMLLDSMVVDSDVAKGKTGDVVRQVYFREGGEGEKDTVMVLNWRDGASTRVGEVMTSEVLGGVGGVPGVVDG